MRARKYQLYGDAEIVFETPCDGYSYFFGYYDKTPLNFSNEKLLVHRTTFDGRDVAEGDEAEVGYFDLTSSFFNSLGRTRAFNWQQGAQLQWLPPTKDEHVVYNDLRDGRFVSVIRSIRNHTEKVIPFPIYAVHPGGRTALAANYERLFFCRPGYLYHGVVEKAWDVPVNAKDGIFQVDLQTGEARLLIRTIDIVKRKPVPEMWRHNNWLEHMTWNPSGTRFAFFHRWEGAGGDHQTRLYTADPEGRNICEFPDMRFYSHLGWKNDREFTVWCRPPTAGGKINKGIRANRSIYRFVKFLYQPMKGVIGMHSATALGDKGAYVTFRDQDSAYSVMPVEVLPENGHNTWCRNGRYMLSDTYQDESKERTLFVYDAARREKHIIGRFVSIYNDCGYRADLHPRFSPDESLIAIDTAHHARRKVLVLSWKS